MEIDTVYRIIGENIKYYRINNVKYGYMTQEKLSRLSMVSLSVIRNLEANKKKMLINLITINNIAKTLDIPLYKFFLVNKV